MHVIVSLNDINKTMNYLDKGISAEQNVLNTVIFRIESAIKTHLRQLEKYISDSESYKLKEELRILQKVRRSLYSYRMITQCQELGSSVYQDNILVGEHDFYSNKDHVIYAWYSPVCAHYILADQESDFHYTDHDDNGRVLGEYDYNLLLKRKIDIFQDEVVRVLDLFNKNQGADEQIIADEFLEELVRRRNEPDFRTIIFTIQKEQSAIIRTSSATNLVVQGCAGSGKTMIMFHRLPVLMFTRGDINQRDVYIITPSVTYQDMIQSMVQALDVEDVHMGTLERYYDWILKKYAEDYSGYINNLVFSKNRKCNDGVLKWVYSQNMVTDADNYLREVLLPYGIDLESNTADTYKEAINRTILEFQGKMDDCFSRIASGFDIFKDYIRRLRTLSMALKRSREDAIDNLKYEIAAEQKIISKAKKDPAIKIHIEFEKSIIHELQDDLQHVEEGGYLFDLLCFVADKIEQVVEPFDDMLLTWSQIDGNGLIDWAKKKQSVLDFMSKVIKTLDAFKKEAGDFELNYRSDLKTIRLLGEELAHTPLEEWCSQYCEYDTKQKELTELQKTLIPQVLVHSDKTIQQIDDNYDPKYKYVFSLYRYLRIIYLYQGMPNGKSEGLIAIDEAQNISLQEYLYMKMVNPGVVFNLYGDIYQHVETDRGISDWKQLEGSIDYSYYDISYNYRNCEEITRYCNNRFNMSMKTVSIHGKPVVEFDSKETLKKYISSWHNEFPRDGLTAVIYKHDQTMKFIRDCVKKVIGVDAISDTNKISPEKLNCIHISRAKGLEFKKVLVIEDEMTENEKYIAATRAMDELVIYKGKLEQNNQLPLEIDVIKGDIALMTEFNAIVCPSGTSFHCMGVAARIVHAAGPDFMMQKNIQRQLAYGEAALCMGYGLYAPYVSIIRTASPRWDGKTAKAIVSLKKCYHNILDIAVKNGIRTIAFPSISTGGNGYPIPLAAKAAVEEVKSYTTKNPGKIDKIVWVCIDDAIFNEYYKLISVSKEV